MSLVSQVLDRRRQHFYQAWQLVNGQWQRMPLPGLPSGMQNALPEEAASVRAARRAALTARSGTSLDAVTADQDFVYEGGRWYTSSTWMRVPAPVAGGLAYVKVIPDGG